MEDTTHLYVCLDGENTALKDIQWEYLKDQTLWSLEILSDVVFVLRQSHGFRERKIFV